MYYLIDFKFTASAIQAKTTWAPAQAGYLKHEWCQRREPNPSHWFV